MAQLRDELFAGGFGGAVGVFVGQPFDFVKVRLQTLGGARYSNAWDCVVQTLRNEGVSGMYRGVTPPLVNSFALNAMAFGGFESGKRVLDGRVASDAWKTFWAGSYAGFIQCAALVPFDLVKCRLQMDRAGTASTMYAGPLDCAVKVVKLEGPIGLYRGSAVTIARDTPSFGLYFLTYEMLEHELPRRFPSVFGETATTLVSGGICGSLTWAISYVSAQRDSHTHAIAPKLTCFHSCCSSDHRAGPRLLVGSRWTPSRRASRQCRRLHLPQSAAHSRSLGISYGSTALVTSTVGSARACCVPSR